MQRSNDIRQYKGSLHQTEATGITLNVAVVNRASIRRSNPTVAIALGQIVFFLGDVQDEITCQFRAGSG